MGVDGLPVQIRSESPPHVYYRASSLGGCTSILVRARMGEEGVEMDRGNAAAASIFAAMEAGKDLEDKVLDAFEAEYAMPLERGDIPVSMEFQYGDVKVEIGGHLDGRCVRVSDGVIVEAKTCSKAEYEAWIKAYAETADPWNHGLFKKYAWQFSVYWACEQPAEGCLIVWNRDTGEHEFVWMTVPPYSKMDIWKRVTEIEQRAFDFDVPDVCDVKTFPCPYFHLHMDDREEFDGDVDVVVQALAERYVALVAEEAKIAEQKKVAYDALVEKVGGKGEFVTAKGWKVTTYGVKGLDEGKVRALAEEAGVDMGTLGKVGVRVTPPKGVRREEVDG